MKKYLFYFVCAICFAFTFYSCSVNYDDTVSLKEETNNEIVPGYGEFMLSVENLNSSYLSVVNLNRTRGFWNYAGKNFTETAVDNAGRLLGGHLGKHFGCVVGSITGNPVGSIGGYVVGRWAGRIIGSVVASYGVFCLFKSPHIGNFDGSNSVKVNFYLPDDCEAVDDSIGYYHNLVMSRLSEHNDKYIDSNGNPDFNLIYDDCVMILKEYGIYNEEVSKDLSFKENVMSYAKENFILSRDFKLGNISMELFQTRLVEGVKLRGVSEKEVAAFSEFSIKIAETCIQLPLNKKMEYADELNNAILQSSMDDEMKEELRSTTNMVVNSSICSEEIK